MANKLPDPSLSRALFESCPDCDDGLVLTTRDDIHDDDGEIKCASCGQQYQLSPV
jgi:transcription elongation factor Elf1